MANPIISWNDDFAGIRDLFFDDKAKECGFSMTVITN